MNGRVSTNPSPDAWNTPFNTEQMWAHPVSNEFDPGLSRAAFRMVVRLRSCETAKLRNYETPQPKRGHAACSHAPPSQWAEETRTPINRGEFCPLEHVHMYSSLGSALRYFIDLHYPRQVRKRWIAGPSGIVRQGLKQVESFIHFPATQACHVY
jgi:hypothetical protein